MPPAIYLDHNATALPDPDAIQAMIPWLSAASNASSVHGPGRRARAAVERARRAVCQSVNGGRPSEIVFTSGATEALHLAIAGSIQPGDPVVISAVEHPAVRGACAMAGAEVITVAVDAEGALDPAAFAAACAASGAKLVVVMGAQNELGNVYPVQAIAEAVAPTPVLCDGAQLWGRRPIDVQALSVAMLTLSSHKIGGPQGAGALWVRPGHALRPYIAGGPQERGLRGGTESVAALVGFGAAAEKIPTRIAEMPRLAALRDQLLATLREALPGFRLHGRPALANTLAFRVEGVPGDLLLAALDLEGIYLSSGAACSSGSLEPSPVLLALGISPEAARGGLRISLGPETTAAEIERAAAAIVEGARRVIEAEAEAL